MSTKIQLGGVFSDQVSFAMQQNHVPIIRELLVSNNTDSELTDLLVAIKTDPDIADEWSSKIQSIPPEQTHQLTGIDIRLSASRLFELTERVDGSITISVSHEDEVLAQDTLNLSFLSYDEWTGANTFPEFIAAFITPNYPYVMEIIKKAGKILEDWSGTSAFTGYQTENPNNVRMQMAAIYGALQGEQISYCMPPASFEEYGQKVRLGGTIREQKLGTCLDLALLYASCLEAAGLHPMIVLIRGHAFVGCWLEERSFPECVQDDVSSLTKRIADGINEICVVETTAFTADKSASFEHAVYEAEKHLFMPENFIYLVDIKRSRGSGIRPLPLRRDDGTFCFDVGEPRKRATITDAPGEMEIHDKLVHVDSIKLSKKEIWERKLLDLTLRNSLLNYRVTQQSIQLFVNSLAELEDALADGQEFQILSCPRDFMNSARDNKIYEGMNEESIWDAIITSEFKNHRIRTFMDEASLAHSIQKLYRSARISLEENGANTLYLAIGFLRWFETDLSEKVRYAPLIMVPIEIVRKSAERGYVIRLRDEEQLFNVTLLEYLRMNHGLSVEGLDPLPEDESGVDVARIFSIVRQMIMNKPRWEVEEIAMVGVFSFAQFIMWNDIRNRSGELERNKIVRSLIAGQMEWETDTSFLSPEMLDGSVSPSDLAVPVAADSSQLAAVHAAGQGHSFVLHGPPGTGKSQTITNIIAHMTDNLSI